MDGLFCASEIRNGDRDVEDPDEMRYALTPLGETILKERRHFFGFGPCAASRSASQLDAVAQSPSARRPRPVRQRVVASLFT